MRREIGLELGAWCVRQTRDGQRRPWLRTHRMQVRQRVRGRDLAEHERVVDEGAEMVHALHQRHSGRRERDRGVIGPLQGEQDVASRRGLDVRERSAQHRGAQLGAAAAATHRVGRPVRHRPHPRVHAHPSPVDAVFPAPGKPRLHCEPIAPGEGISAPQAENDERLPLRPPTPQASSACGTAKIGRRVQAPARTAPNSRLRAWRVGDAGAVAGREHDGVADAAQGGADDDAARLVASQPRCSKERGRDNACRPEHGLTPEEAPIRERQVAKREHSGAHAADQFHAGFAECGPCDAPGTVGGGRERVRRIAHQGQAETAAVAVGECQRQLRPGGASPGDRDARSVEEQLLKLSQSVEETPDRFHGNALAVALARNRGLAADVDRKQVEGDGRPIGDGDRALLEVDAGRARHHQPCPGRGGKRGEIDVCGVERIVAAQQARQHSRVGRLRLAADYGQAGAGLRPHGKATQHFDMGVPGAKQDDVGGHRGGGFHLKTNSTGAFGEGKIRSSRTRS